MTPIQPLLRLQDVLTLIPVSRATWYDGIKNGRYPKPVHLSPRRVAWRVEDIRQLMQEVAQ